MSDRIKRIAGGAVAVAVLLGLTIFTIYRCGGFSARLVPVTVNASEITVDRLVGGNGYIFRSEIPVTLNGKSVLDDSSRSEGEKVRAGDMLLLAYPCADQTEAEKKQQALAELDDRIAFLKQCMATEGGSLSEADRLRQQMQEAYRLAVGASINGEMTEASEAAKNWLLYQSQYATLIGSSAISPTALSELQTQRSRLLSGTATQVTAECGGYYYSADAVDGYERLWRAETLMNSSADGLFALLTVSPEQDSSVVCKLITDYTWYLAVELSAPDAHLLQEGERYTVHLKENGQEAELPMIYETLKTSSEGRCLAVFSCDRLSGEMLFRTAEVTVTVDTVSGYRVPNEAIRNQDGETGVFILTGGEVSWRRVTILETCPEYSVAAPRDLSKEDYREYLNRDEAIILDGKDLYDGKYYD